MIDVLEGRELKIKCLDDGFVRLVDVMPRLSENGTCDFAIIQAARISYGEGTKKVSDDRSLIRYLMRHKHTTPFEMCLRGDTNIPTMPGRSVTRKCKTIKEIANAFSRNEYWVKQIKIRSVDWDGNIVPTSIKFCKSTGIQPIYKITTDSLLPRQIYVTKNHPILTPDGYKQVSELKINDLVVINGCENSRSGMVDMWRSGEKIGNIAENFGVSQTTVYRELKKQNVSTKRRNGFKRKDDTELAYPRARSRRLIKEFCEICSLPAQDVHHLDGNKFNNSDENLASVCKICHKAFHNDKFQLRVYNSRIKSIDYVGCDEVFDLEVESENHNFVAEGFVVHNCEFKFHIRLPMDVNRQLIRHRTANVNEYSTRYSEAIDACQKTDIDKWRVQSKENKQGSSNYLTKWPTEVGTGPKNLHTGDHFTYSQVGTVGNYLSIQEGIVQSLSRRAYEERLRLGVSREQARKDLPLSTYTELYWKCDLHNILHFLNLRCDSHAQEEIREYANAMLQLITPLCPITIEAWNDYSDMRKGVRLSRLEIQALKKMLDNPDEFTFEPLDSTNKRECEEWKSKYSKFFGDEA